MENHPCKYNVDELMQQLMIFLSIESEEDATHALSEIKKLFDACQCKRCEIVKDALVFVHNQEFNQK